LEPDNASDWTKFLKNGKIILPGFDETPLRMRAAKRARGFLVSKIGKEQVFSRGNKREGVRCIKAANIFDINGVGNNNMAALFKTEDIPYPGEPVSLVFVRLHRDICSLVIYFL
jgi:hypothetical protein